MKHRILLAIVAMSIPVGTLLAANNVTESSIKAAFEQMWEDNSAFSPEFKQLLDEDRAICEKYGILPCVEHDLWVHNMGACPGDSHEIAGINDVTSSSATVCVKVTNCGDVSVEQFRLICADGQWRVDDIIIDGNSEKQALKDCLQAAKQHLTAPGQTVCVTGNHVRLRWSPEIKAGNIVLDEHSRTKYFNRGDKFKYLADAGDFYEVSYNGDRAYISKKYSTLKDK